MFEQLLRKFRKKNLTATVDIHEGALLLSRGAELLKIIPVPGECKHMFLLFEVNGGRD